MKTKNSNTLITNLYKNHYNNIVSRKDEDYLMLFKHYNDLLSNITDEDLKQRILYSHIRIEELLFNNIISTSKTFYELGFNDLKYLLFKEQKIDNKDN